MSSNQTNLLQGTLDLSPPRRARFYRLTKAGERQFGQETEQWEKIVSAMTNALKAT